MLRLALWVEGSDRTVCVAVRQSADGAVSAAVVGDLPDRTAGQLARIRGSDVDAAGVAEVAAADPVVRGAGAPDVFPAAERRLHEEMAQRHAPPPSRRPGRRPG